MLDNFLIELEELLHSKPYAGVNILPLVEKYSVDQDSDETSKTRLRIRSIIDQLKTDDLIDPSSNYHFQLAYKPAGQYSQEPIILKSTLKFERQYNAKQIPPGQPVSNFITHGDNSPIAGHQMNMGDIIQSSSRNLDLNAPHEEPSSYAETKQSSIKKAFSYIADHIVKIIVGLIILYLAIKLGLKN